MSSTFDQRTGAAPQSDATRSIVVRRIGGDRPEPAGAARAVAYDRVAVEAPLQVVVNDEPFAVIMRTPGADEALAAGFLHAEGCIARAEDVVRMTTSKDAAGRDGIAVTLGPTAVGPAWHERRRVDVNAACGMCGRVRVESIEIDRAPLTAMWTVSPALVAASPTACAPSSACSTRPAGCTRRASSTRDGGQLALAEDVGRHNAVDKVVGRMLLRGPAAARRRLLVVSGRTRVRDRAEGVARRHSARRRGLGAFEPRGRPGGGGRHHAGRLRARRPLQRLRARGTDRLTRPSVGPFIEERGRP